MHRYTPMTEGYIFLPRAVRPEVKKYNPRSEVYYLCIYTDKEVVFLHNSDLKNSNYIVYRNIILKIENLGFIARLELLLVQLHNRRLINCRTFCSGVRIPLAATRFLAETRGHGSWVTHFL